MYLAILLIGILCAEAQYADSVSVSYPYEAGPPSSNSEQQHKGVYEEKTELPPIIIPSDSRLNLQDEKLQYSHGFSDSGSGISLSEQGHLLSTNDGWEYVIVKEGYYSYISPEGVSISVKYIADHNGFRIV